MTDKSWNESEVDALMRGRHPRDPELMELVPAVAALRAGLDLPVAEGRVSEVSSRLAVAAAEALSSVPAKRPPWARRLTTAGVAAAVLGAGFASVAAADAAAPGDALYGLDRALERVGIHDGGFAERLSEANELVDAGDSDGAIDLLADSLYGEGDAEGKQALLDAAAKLRENGSEQSADVHAAVAAMLTWMATTEATGKAFGQGVAEHAREIHGKPDVATPTPTPSPSEEPSGKPDKPEGVGKPTAEPSAKPDDAGKPDSPDGADSPGKPDGVGKPTDKGTGKPTAVPNAKPEKGKP